MKTIIAPAKLNLFLHVIGKDHHSYHLLQSLVTFADFGDVITLTPSDKYSIDVKGESSSNISYQDNLVTKAIQGLEELTGDKFNFHITLEKNIPSGAGLGGGSSDAAAVVKALLDIKNITLDNQTLLPFLTTLGADVPICFAQKTSFVEGIGEKITPVKTNEALYAVLVHPKQHSDTAEIFKSFKQNFSNPVDINEKQNITNMLSFIKNKKNDLTDAAVSNTLAINGVLTVLQSQSDCVLTRMTGSGSCCFGLFPNNETAQKSAEEIQLEHPEWWVKKTTLNTN